MLLNMTITNQSEDQPLFIRLLTCAGTITPEQVRVLIDQTKAQPSVPLEELLLKGGYVTESEMESLRIAKHLLEQGKVTEAQIRGAMAVNLQLPPEPN
jgi:hypothetical protein